MTAKRLIVCAFLALSLSAPAVGAAVQPSVDTDAAVAACATPEERQRAMASLPDARRLALLACLNRYAAEQINAQTPMRVDEMTTLVSVATVGTTVIYNQRVDADARDITPAMKASIEQAVRARACASEDMRNTISYGGVYAYNWVDRSGAFIHSFHIERC